MSLKQQNPEDSSNNIKYMRNYLPTMNSESGDSSDITVSRDSSDNSDSGEVVIVVTVVTKKLFQPKPVFFAKKNHTRNVI